MLNRILIPFLLLLSFTLSAQNTASKSVCGRYCSENRLRGNLESANIKHRLHVGRSGHFRQLVVAEREIYQYKKGKTRIEGSWRVEGDTLVCTPAKEGNVMKYEIVRAGKKARLKGFSKKCLFVFRCGRVHKIVQVVPSF